MTRILQYLGGNWIAIAALLVSSWLLYREHVRPFRLCVQTAGRITICKNPFALLKHGAVLLDVLFVNRGAKRGFVKDVAISVQGEGGTELLRTLAVARDRSMNLQKALATADMETFIGFELAQDEAAVRRLLFVPRKSTSQFQFEERTYHADL